MTCKITHLFSCQKVFRRVSVQFSAVSDPQVKLWVSQWLQNHVIVECSKQLTGTQQPCYRDGATNPNIAKHLA